MPKMIICLNGSVLKEVQLTKDRMSLGRRPYNDIVIDSMAVSGEHAVVQLSGSEACLEDLNSTNGTYVNGKTVKKYQLQHGDIVEIGKYKIQYVDDAIADVSALNGAIKVMSGPAAGREMALVKHVTTIGKAGVGVASISKTTKGFVVTHLEGVSQPTINGVAVSAEPVSLKHGDMLELAGTQMQFVQH